MNLEKSINKLTERLEEIDPVNEDQIDSDKVARQRYEEYREHWYFHKSSWYVRGLNAYDGEGCNAFTGCIPECRFYAVEGMLSEDEGFN